MEQQIWHKFKWPKEVPLTLSRTPQPLYQILDDRVKETPDKTYTIFADHAQTYRQIWDMANRAATFLVQKGIKPGQSGGPLSAQLAPFPGGLFRGLKGRGGLCDLQSPVYGQGAELPAQGFRGRGPFRARSSGFLSHGPGGHQRDGDQDRGGLRH